jgi:hypothetical protein
VAARRVTFSAAAGDLTLPWLAQLGDFLAVAYSAELLDAGPPPAPLGVSVHLRVRAGSAPFPSAKFVLDAEGLLSCAASYCCTLAGLHCIFDQSRAREK